MTPAQRTRVLDGLGDREKAALGIAIERAVQERRALRSDRYRAFKRRYRDDPAAFVVDCISWDRVREGDGPADYQIAILDELAYRKRVAARGPHGLGKSTVEAWAILWFALTSDGEDWKSISTASAWRQLTVYLWPEVHKWSRLLDWTKIGRAPLTEKKELLDLAIKLGTGAGTAVASNDHEKIEGAHADRLLFAYDEAKIIPEATWDASEGAFSTGECYGLACSTPGAPMGRFYDIHTRKPGFEDWTVIHITKEQAIKAGRMSAEWAEQRRLQWGEDSALYRNRVLGEFCETASDGVIPLSWIEAAIDRWHLWDEAGRPGTLVSIGADIGESTEGDPTALAPRMDVERKDGSLGIAIDTIEIYEGLDPVQSAEKIDDMMSRWSEINARVQAVVDAIGIGSGTVAALKKMGRQVVAFVASAKARRAKDEEGLFGFHNLRADAWWNLREMLDPQKEPDIMLPPDEEDHLIGELASPRFREMAGGKIAIESKDEIRKRLKRSTNLADAVVQVMHERPLVIAKKVSVSKRRAERRPSVWRKRK